jgi:Holliday junction resolvase RusA-like endonuclease
MKISLPKPPSVNHIYGLSSTSGHARSYITAEGVAWFQQACSILDKQFDKETITTPIAVLVKLYHYRKQDIDNINKPLLDSLHKWCLKCQTRIVRKIGCKCNQNHKVIEDDDQVYDLHTIKFRVGKGEREYVEITITG